MDWQGFLAESKFYKGYPGYYRDGTACYSGNYKPPMSDEEWAKSRPTRFETKIKFWLAFPYALVRYAFLTLRG